MPSTVRLRPHPENYDDVPDFTEPPVTADDHNNTLVAFTREENGGYHRMTHHYPGTLDTPRHAQWLHGEQETRTRWRTLVTTRREHLSSGR